MNYRIVLQNSTYLLFFFFFFNGLKYFFLSINESDPKKRDFGSYSLGCVKANLQPPLPDRFQECVLAAWVWGNWYALWWDFGSDQGASWGPAARKVITMVWLQSCGTLGGKCCCPVLSSSSKKNYFHLWFNLSWCIEDLLRDAGSSTQERKGKDMGSLTSTMTW